MSDDPKPPARSVRRFRIGFLSVLQIVCALLLFLAINFLSSQIHRPWDVSDDLTFTLSPSTRRYLESPAVQDREDPIHMIVAFRASSPFYTRIRPVAEEFARLSQGKVKISVLDPIRANDLAESLAAEYRIQFTQDLVVIDASPKSEDSGETQAMDGKHVQIVRLEDMLVHDTDSSNQRKVRGFIGEEALRASLVNAIEGKPRRMWIFADKSDLTSVGNEGIWDVVVTQLATQNILAERVSLSETEEIPEDVESIAIIGAVTEFSPAEISVLESYWRRPRASILVTTGSKDVPPRLRAFLRTSGVTPQSDRVLTVKSNTTQTTVTASFSKGLDFLRDLAEKSTLFEGYTRSLEVRENAEDLLNQRIMPYSLLDAGSQFWGDRDFAPPALPVQDPQGETSGPHLAAAVVRGNATDDRFAGQVSRMVVIGNTDFLAPDNLRQTNLDFFASCANWLIGREDLAGEGPANLRLYKLPLLPPQVTFINRINLLLMPALILVIGAFIWSSRRS
ncbi:hypothetical protein HNR46_000324 [Haloferula luteola]|uniref:ABC-type uncharacterized transport system domain-containing protein n=1 Tax=Haloferula luteola TaxID=595692 RepID=A0A840UYL9_9BACT|nr:Gldg family protein [Haloferula luteola]MBB5350103.1 hypothetical protein [Haloferula luteola]